MVERLCLSNTLGGTVGKKQTEESVIAEQVEAAWRLHDAELAAARLDVPTQMARRRRPGLKSWDAAQRFTGQSGQDVASFDSSGMLMSPS